MNETTHSRPVEHAPVLAQQRVAHAPAIDHIKVVRGSAAAVVSSAVTIGSHGVDVVVVVVQHRAEQQQRLVVRGRVETLRALAPPRVTDRHDRFFTGLRIAPKMEWITCATTKASMDELRELFGLATDTPPLKNTRS